MSFRFRSTVGGGAARHPVASGRHRAVKPADVQRMAAIYLDPQKMTIVVVGDRKLVDTQLKPWSGGGAKSKSSSVR